MYMVRQAWMMLCAPAVGFQWVGAALASSRALVLEAGARVLSAIDQFLKPV